MPSDPDRFGFVVRSRSGSAPACAPGVLFMCSLLVVGAALRRVGERLGPPVPGRHRRGRRLDRGRRSRLRRPDDRRRRAGEPDERRGDRHRRRARAARRVRQDPPDQGLGAGRHGRRVRPAGSARPDSSTSDDDLGGGARRRTSRPGFSDGDRRGERVRARPRRPVPRDVPADPAAGSDRGRRRLRDLPGRGADREPHRPDAARRAPDRRASMAAALLLLLFGAFSGASRLLARQNRELRRSEERFRSLVQNSIDVQLIVDADGTITYESAAVERVLGYQAEDRIGRHALDDVHPDDRDWAAADASRRRSGSRLRRCRPRSAFAMPTARGSSSRPSRRTCSTTRPSAASSSTTATSPARKSLEDELKRQAFHDSLTGLANRALFADRLEHAIVAGRARRRARSRSSSSISTTSRPSTTASATARATSSWSPSRTGSGPASGPATRSPGWAATSSPILIEDPVDGETPMDVGRRMLAHLEPPFVHGGKELFVRASIGIATTRARDHTADEVLRNADVAMYTAKANGKNRLEVFEPGMHAAALTRLALKGDLERALERDEFTLVYQPIVGSTGGSPVGRRGAAALATPGSRDRRTDRVHPGRRGDRPDPAARPLGARAGLHAGRGVERDLAPADHDERERVRPPAPASGLRRRGRRDPRVDGARAAAPDAGAHRERPDAGRRGRDRGARAS